MPNSPRIRWRRGRREAAARLEVLVGGEAVDLPCRLRRTTSRGWGEWMDGLLRLPGPGDGWAPAFVADDPSEVALVTRKGEAPVVLDAPRQVALRPVRYRAEAFHGTEAEIVVVTSPRRVVEIARRRLDIQPGQVAAVAVRAHQRLDPMTVGQQRAGHSRADEAGGPGDEGDLAHSSPRGSAGGRACRGIVIMAATLSNRTGDRNRKSRRSPLLRPLVRGRLP